MQTEDEKSKPWYCYKIVWFIIFVPTLALVASGVTLYMAIVSTESPPYESYYKRALSPGELSEKEEIAKKLGIDATMKVEGDKLYFYLNQNISDQTLTLKFRHATLARKDFVVDLLRKSDDQAIYYHDIPKDFEAYKWDLLLDSTREGWRIKARRLPGEMELKLTPFSND